MDAIKIVIPSAGRYDCVLTDIKNQIICAPNSEINEYREYNQCEIIGHPKLKNLAEKRNWIINKFGDVFMVDDDSISFERVYVKVDQIIDSVKTYDIIQSIYQNAKNSGAFLFGFSEDPNPNHYNPYKPIMLKGMMSGGAYGIIKNGGLYFNTNTTACDSHWINLLNAYKNRFLYIDTRFCFRFKDTFKANGGQSLKRTLESEKRDTIFLREQFGEVVKLRANKKDAKAQHQYQRTIKYEW